MKLLTSCLLILAFCLFHANAEFDLKAKLQEHRALHTNHLQKDYAYKVFSRHDENRIEALRSIVEKHERKLRTGDTSSQRKLAAAKNHLAEMLNESQEEREERYQELHTYMFESESLDGIDFHATGL